MKQAYILSDAECVLHWMKDMPLYNYDFPPDGASEHMIESANYDYEQRVEQAKSTAVRFADQRYAQEVIADKYGWGKYEPLKPNTIYTVEGYEVEEFNLCTSYPEPCENGLCDHLKYGTKLATLKRIEPVVEQDNDEWIRVEDRLPDVEPLEVIQVIVYDGRKMDFASYRHREFSLGSHSRIERKITHWKKQNPPKQ